MGKTFNDPTNPVATLLDEDYNLLIQKGSDPSGTTYKLAMTELIDFILGRFKNMRAISGDALAIFNDDPTPLVVGGMLPVKFDEGLPTEQEAVAAIGAIVDLSGSAPVITGLRPLMLDGSAIQIEALSLILKNLPGALPGGALHLDSQDGQRVVALPPVPPANPALSMTSTNVVDLSASPGAWTDLASPDSIDASFGINADAGYYEFSVHITNDQAQDNRGGTIKIGIGINGAMPVVAEETPTYNVANIYSAEVTGILAIKTAISINDLVRLYAWVTNDHGNTNIQADGTINLTYLSYNET